MDINIAKQVLIKRGQTELASALMATVSGIIINDRKIKDVQLDEHKEAEGNAVSITIEEDNGATHLIISIVKGKKLFMEYSYFLSDDIGLKVDIFEGENRK